MSLSEILPSVRLLSASDKLHLIRLLAVEIDDSESVAPLEHGRTYQVHTPRFDDGAAEALLRELDSAAVR
jgi:hypothetical protein